MNDDNAIVFDKDNLIEENQNLLDYALFGNTFNTSHHNHVINFHRHTPNANPYFAGRSCFWASVV